MLGSEVPDCQYARHRGWRLAVPSCVPVRANMTAKVGSSVRDHYDEYYGGSELSEWRQLGAIDKAKNVLDLCRGLPVRSVLDVGCGDGSLLARLAAVNFAREYRGVDISGSAIREASTKAIDGAQFETFDGDALPFQPGTFSVALLSHVVEHLEHPRVLLHEAARVARYVVIEVPCEHTIRLSQDYVPDSVGHINFYTPKTIRRLVQTCGLNVEKQITRGCSLAVLRHSRPLSGVLQYMLREVTLRVAQRAAPAIFVYHSALLCSRSRRRLN
jgi:ubiquinone/menaquinone biosynthesis C-methylase UbiE